MASAFVVAEPRSRLARLLPAGLVALAWILIAVHAWVLLAAAWPFTTDDAWITLRYARNLAAGEGVTWNAGEPPVEGYSNFLYVVIGAAALRLGLGLPELLKILGTGFLAVALAAQFVLCRRRAGDPIGVVPSVVFLSYWSVPLWTVSGLETPAYVAFSMLAFVALDRWRAEAVEGGAPSRRADLRALGAGLWILLAALTRPEGPLVGIAIAAGLLLGRRSRAAGDGEPAPGAAARWRGFALMLVTSALPYGFYAAWKLVHFGSLLPNSVRCKALYPGDPFQLPGDALALAAWFLPTALFALARRRGIVEVALAVFVVLSGGILFGTDPIIGHGNRHFLAAWAALLVLSAIGAKELLLLLGKGRSRPVLDALAVTAVLVIAGRDLLARAEFLGRTAASYSRREAVRERLAETLNERLGVDGTVVIGDCGVVGYRTRARVLDALCLNDRETARPGIRDDPARRAESLLARDPDAVVIHSLSPDRLVPRPESGIFRALVENEALWRRYALSRVIPGVGDGFSYFVFERGPTAEASP